MRSALAEIDQLLVEWEPPAELKNKQPTYPYKLKHELGAQLYISLNQSFQDVFGPVEPTVAC